MQRFLFGFLCGVVGLGIVQALRHRAYNTDRIDNYYKRRAASYAATDQWVKPRVLLRQLIVQQLELKEGMRVLDLACGTGANFPYILEKIGNSGEIVGVDYSADMLAEAQNIIDRKGWQNVRVIQHDAATIDLEQEFDAVMCVMGMVVIPDYQSALKKMWEHLKPEGRFAIADLSESQRWYMRPFNGLLNSLIDTFLVTDTTRQPWEDMKQYVTDYRREDIALGYMYSAVGRKKG